MGVAYYIELENTEPGFDTLVDGKSIAHDVVGVSNLCAAAGIADINDFVSLTADDMAGMGFDMADADGVLPVGDPKWFTPDEGLAWIQALRGAIQSKRSALRNADDVLEDLAAYERVMTQAKAIGTRWRLGVDI